MNTDNSHSAFWRLRFFTGIASFIANTCVTVGVFVLMFAVFTSVPLGIALALIGYGAAAMIVLHLFDALLSRIYTPA